MYSNTAQKANSVSIRLISFSEVIGSYSENRMRNIKTPCRKNTELLTLISGGIHSYRFTVRGLAGRDEKKYEILIRGILAKRQLGLLRRKLHNRRHVALCTNYKT
jgi:hypothetical protein